MLLVAAFTKEAIASSGHMIIVVLIITWPLCMPGGNSELALMHVGDVEAVLSGFIHRVSAALSSLAFSHYDLSHPTCEAHYWKDLISLSQLYVTVKFDFQFLAKTWF